MKNLPKTVLMITALVLAGITIWLLPKSLAAAHFLESDYLPNDWGLMLFSASLAALAWGACMHALYRHHAPKGLSLIGWFVPISVFVVYVRNSGTFRASAIAIATTALILAGNGLGRAFSGQPKTKPVHKLVLAAWLVLAVLEAKICPRFIVGSPQWLGPTVALLIIGGAYSYFQGANPLLRGVLCAIILLGFAEFGLLQYNAGFRPEDVWIGIGTPILAFLFGFAETRWKNDRPISLSKV